MKAMKTKAMKTMKTMKANNMTKAMKAMKTMSIMKASNMTKVMKAMKTKWTVLKMAPWATSLSSYGYAVHTLRERTVTPMKRKPTAKPMKAMKRSRKVRTHPVVLRNKYYHYFIKRTKHSEKTPYGYKHMRITRLVRR